MGIHFLRQNGLGTVDGFEDPAILCGDSAQIDGHLVLPELSGPSDTEVARSGPPGHNIRVVPDNSALQHDTGIHQGWQWPSLVVFSPDGADDLPLIHQIRDRLARA